MTTYNNRFPHCTMYIALIIISEKPFSISKPTQLVLPRNVLGCLPHWGSMRSLPMSLRSLSYGGRPSANIQLSRLIMICLGEVRYGTGGVHYRRTAAIPFWDCLGRQWRLRTGLSKSDQLRSRITDLKQNKERKKNKNGKQRTKKVNFLLCRQQNISHQVNI